MLKTFSILAEENVLTVKSLIEIFIVKFDLERNDRLKIGDP
jgi:hypothetical protein